MMKKISKNSFFPLFLLLVSFATQAEQTINHNIANKWPDSRYAVNNDGTVTEIETGLMWQQCSLGQVWTESNGRISCEGDAIEYTGERQFLWPQEVMTLAIATGDCLMSKS